MNKTGSTRAKVKSVDASTLPSLAKGWCWATIGDLAAHEPNAITDGPFGSNLKSSHYTDAGPRVVRLQNIGDGVFVDAKAHISESHFASLAKHQVFPGDLVIAALGETLPRSCIMPSWVGTAIVKADCPRFKPNHSVVSSEYVNYVLNSSETRRRTASIIHGVGRPRLNLSEIRGTWVPVPPVNEQGRIVTKIDELFSDLDAGVAALERVKAKLKHYRAAVLKAAVEGKLTEAWRKKNRSKETGQQLLGRILAERRCKWEEEQVADYEEVGTTPPAKWKDRYAEPAGPNGGSLPELPEGWCLASVGQLLVGIEAGKSFECLKRQAARDEWGIIKVSAMTWGEFIEEENKAIPLNAVFDSHSEIQAGDVLLSRSNTVELVGATVFVKQCRPKLLLSDKSMRLLVNPALNRMWLQKAMSSCIARQQLSAMATGTSDSMRNVSQEKVTLVNLPLPPFDEQAQIVEELETRLSGIDAAVSQIEANLKRSARLRQSILKRAFEGKLVPQDPKDEPASVLLERIRTSRITHPDGPAVANTRIRGWKKKTGQTDGTYE